MEKILGYDLGTNSIGWTIRDVENENQVIDYGVVVFKKGVAGNTKSGEISLAAERRGYRGKRRLYNAKRYRKWALLKVLIKAQMCPTEKDGGLSMDALRIWSIGEWVEENGKKINNGRKYPMNEEFLLWLRMDEKYFGSKGVTENGKIIRKSPYDLRCELLEGYVENERERKMKLGRAFYHLCQRRGFKSNTKGNKSTFKPDESYAAAIKENSQITPALVWNKDLVEKNIRIRGRGKIDREEFVKEFKALCESQRIDVKLSEDLYKAIYTVRPLRSQKGLVGKCTLEKGKTRIPISHPMFEEFRALQFINNIKKRIKDSDEPFKNISIEEKRKILADLFFRKSKPNFKFEEITERFSEKGKYEFNYDRKNPSVSACPFIAGLMDVFGDEWKDEFITTNDKFGINWSSLSLAYTVAYGKKKGKERILKIDYDANDDSLWHLLFDFVQTKDDDEKLIKFLTDVVGWNEVKAKQFAEIKVSQGYGSLSGSAIRKIIPYLQDGNIYSEAVSFANLHEVFREEKFKNLGEQAKEAITKVIAEIKDQKEKLNIVNGLIQQHYAIFKSNKSQGITSKTTEQALKDIEQKLVGYFTENNWNKFSENKRKEYRDFVTEKYLKFLDGKQETTEKAAYKEGKHVPPTDYYKLPRLDEAIKAVLRKEPFNIDEESLNKLYHPSDIDIYPPAEEKEIVDKETGEVIKVKQLGQPMPPSKGWKNPMAMRTMHELRELTNYLLLREDKPDKPRIDENTKIVVEVARELNDANYRKAISDWQDDRDNENEEYKKAIAELFNIPLPGEDNYERFRLAVEQIEEIEIEENKKSTFKRKYNEFVQTYITGEIEIEADEDAETSDIASGKESINKINSDYLMYLILHRDKFNQLLNYKIPNSKKFIKQIIKPVKDYKKRRDELKEMLLKYRLWKQQKFQCFYTGKQIPLTELFTNNYQIEHTIPRSISFDSELKNLTICDAAYNNYEKDNKFPTECKNYYASAKCRTNDGEKECTPIEGRVNRLIKPKVEELEERIRRLKNAAKSIPEWEVERRNANIRLRHYLEFEYEYWKKKLDTFTVEKKDWKDKMKNSQLVDTQLVSKYSRAYLKSLFNRVDVQKGVITSEFRKIFGLNKKVRDNHAHHAVDAMVLTLIPGSATRDNILKIYYELEECKKAVKSRPEKQERIEVLEAELEKELAAFNLPYIRNKEKEIKGSVLINHISKDRTLIHTKKKARKRGKVDFVRDKVSNTFVYEKDGAGNDIYQTTKDGKRILQKDKNGNLVPVRKKKTKYLEGDSVRGELHLQTYFGTIMKKPLLDEHGKPIKEEKEIERRNRKTGQIEKIRKEVYLFEKLKEPAYTIKEELTEKLNISKIVDPALIDAIYYQIEVENKKFGKDDFYYLGNKLRHVKTFAGATEPVKVRRNIFISKTNGEENEHKHWVYATNRGNYCLCIYRGVINKGTKKEKIETKIDLLTIRELGKRLKSTQTNNIKLEGLIETSKEITPKDQIQIYHTLKTGDKIIFYEGDKKEAQTNYSEKKNLLQKMIYRVTDFEGDKRINIVQCIQSGEKEKMLKTSGNFNFRTPPQKWRAVFGTMEAAGAMFERLDFEIKPDGEIKWKF